MSAHDPIYITGHGAVLTIDPEPIGQENNPPITVSAVRRVGAMQFQGQSADITHLGSGKYRKKLKPDTFENQPWDVQQLWDVAATFDPADAGLRSTITLQYAAGPGQTTGGKWSGYGWTESWQSSPVESDTELVAGFTIRWEDKPAWTAGIPE